MLGKDSNTNCNYSLNISLITHMATFLINTRSAVPVVGSGDIKIIAADTNETNTQSSVLLQSGVGMNGCKFFFLH